MPISNGLYYYFHQAGRAMRPPLILLHGAGGDHLVWPAGIRRMPGFNIHALDLPGHGKSSGTGKQNAADYARSVIAFMDSIGLLQAVFIGHSLGGAVALSLALDHPGRTAGLALLSTGARLPVPADLLAKAASPSTFPFAARVMHELSCGAHTPPRLAAQNLARLQVLRPALFHGDLLACDHFDVSERLESIHTPVLVICGTQDRLTPLHHSTALAARIPGAALQTVEEAGHLIMLEKPERVARLLAVFMQTVPYPPEA